MVSSCLIIVLTIAAIAMKCEDINAYRILGLFPMNTRSHFMMSQELMKILAKKGHQVDVVSHYPLKEALPNYKDFSLEGSLPSMRNNFTYSAMQVVKAASFKDMIELVGTPVCELLKHPVINNIIKNPPKNPPYDLVIMEVLGFPCYFAFGRHLKVPMIGVTTTSIYDWSNERMGNPSSLAFVPSFLSPMPPNMNFWQRLHNVLLFGYVRYEYSLYVEKQKKFIDENFGLGYPSIAELEKELSLLLVNSYHTLNGVRPFTPGVVEVGGLHIDDKNEQLIPELQKWLDESTHGCIYVSFGSQVKLESFPKENIEAFYAAFRNIAPVRVLMKIANKEELIPGLPKNVKVHHWLPQNAVLKHKNVKTFITHGGLMGTLEAIYHGVPMVGIPLMGDQIHNLNACEKKKIAVQINKDNITENSLTEAINKVLKDPEIRTKIAKIAKLYFDRPMSPQDTAIFWIEYVIRNGNILRSPAIDLEWWQVELLDVYGFILFTILIIIYILLFIIRKFVKCLCNFTGRKDALLKKKLK